MSSASKVARAAAGGLVALAVAVAPAEARQALSVAAGAAPYDLAGVGTSGTAAVRVEWPLGGRAELQAGTSFFWYGVQGDDASAFLFPEAGLFVRPLGAVPLRVGAGVGHSVAVDGRSQADPTLFAALGVDVEDRAGWAVRPEVRVRAVDPWAGTVAELTLGVRRRFGAG